MYPSSPQPGRYDSPLGWKVLLGGIITAVIGATLVLYLQNWGVLPTSSQGPQSLTVASGGGLGTDEATCQRLKSTFPQSVEGIREKFNLPDSSTVTPATEWCEGMVVNGFVLKGSVDVQLEVPSGGCIDAYRGAHFTGPTEPESTGGLRAKSGFVQAVSLTYRAAWCDRTP
jgi:hypothetical protein